MINRLPSFFVIGVQKAGTTTLHDWLTQQPSICLPKIKETHFFSHNDRYNRGINWYLKQFPKCKETVIMGEVDPEYIFHEKAPLRIRNLIESPKFICIFRNPIERAYSHYLWSVRRGQETLSFPEALQEEKNRRAKSDKHYLTYHSYMERAKYCEQIAKYMQIFPDARFLYIKFDDLFNAETYKATYARICEFLELRSKPICPDISKKSNQASNPRSTRLRNFIYGHSSFKKIIGSFIPSKQLKLRLALFFDGLNQSPIKNKYEYPRQYIPNDVWEIANHEVLQLEVLTGLDLRDWIDKRGNFIQKPEGRFCGTTKKTG
ncbi:MAG: sulfotransferase [Candidatus Brocadia sp.]|nr:sulfotransferase [Candidatus Brocadia sp.]